MLTSFLIGHKHLTEDHEDGREHNLSLTSSNVQVLNQLDDLVNLLRLQLTKRHIEETLDHSYPDVVVLDLQAIEETYLSLSLVQLVAHILIEFEELLCLFPLFGLKVTLLLDFSLVGVLLAEEADQLDDVFEEVVDDGVYLVLKVDLLTYISDWYGTFVVLVRLL